MIWTMNINSEARGKKFWFLPRNNIDPGIIKLEVRNLKSFELGDISIKWRFFSAHYSPYIYIAAYTLLAKKILQKHYCLKFVGTGTWNLKHPKYFKYSIKYLLSSWKVPWSQWSDEVRTWVRICLFFLSPGRKIFVSFMRTYTVHVCLCNADQ